MGELSKKIGQHGEEAAENFFNMVGWNNLRDGLDIDCQHPQRHKRSQAKGDRKTHGVDLLYSYLCPFEPNVRKQFIISVKNQHSEEIEKISRSPSKIKNDLNDISTALTCFKYSPSYKTNLKKGKVKVSELIGILIYLDENPSQPQRRDSHLSSNMIPQEGNFTLTVIDVQRYDFIVKVHQNLKLKFDEWDYHYYIFNSSPMHHGSLSSFMPFSYLSGGAIPIALTRKVKNNSVEKKLLIYVAEKFNAEYLASYVSMAMKLTQEWANTTILFPDYNRTNHSEIAQTIIQEMQAIENVVVSCGSYSNIERSI